MNYLRLLQLRRMAADTGAGGGSSAASAASGATGGTGDDGGNAVGDGEDDADDDTDASKDKPDKEKGKQKILTQDQVDALVKKIKADQKKAVADALEEGKRLAKLSAEDLAKEEAAKQKKELAAGLEALRVGKLENLALRELSKLGLDESALTLIKVDYTDEDSVKQSLKTFADFYGKSLETGLEKKLRGKTPTQAPKGDASIEAIRASMGLKSKK